jgi:Na+/proline symporter
MLLFWIGRVICWVLGVLAIFVLFPGLSSRDFLSFLLLGFLGGDSATFLFTLIITYVYTHINAQEEEDVYEDSLNSSGSLKPSTQLWLGINFALLPELLSVLIGAVAGLLVHVWLGWGWFGTLSVCVLVGVVSEVVLQFVFVMLAGVIASKTTEN